MSLDLLPDHALVGLITYGTMAHVHELGYVECAKSYVFRGSKEYTAKQVQEMLGLSQPAFRPGAPPHQQPQPGRPIRWPGLSVLAPCSSGQVSVDQGSRAASRRIPGRSPTTAEACDAPVLPYRWPLASSRPLSRMQGGRIMLFAGGPATEGPGMVVGPELRSRSAHIMISTATTSSITRRR